MDEKFFSFKNELINLFGYHKCNRILDEFLENENYRFCENISEAKSILNTLGYDFPYNDIDDDEKDLEEDE